jgi:hypothetical protein
MPQVVDSVTRRRRTTPKTRPARGLWPTRIAWARPRSRAWPRPTTSAPVPPAPPCCRPWSARTTSPRTTTGANLLICRWRPTYRAILYFAPRGNLWSQGRSCPQGPILNFVPRGKLWPQGAKLSPRGEFCPLDGGEVIPRWWSYPLGWNYLFSPPLF